MLCEIVLIRTDGVLAPRWQLGNLPVLRGELVIRDEQVPDLGRSSKMAFLAGLEHSPRLYDTVLIGTQGAWLSLSGFERVDLGGRWADYAQTWLVTPVARDNLPS